MEKYSKMTQETKKQVLETLEGDNEKEFVVALGDIILMAKNEEEAQEQALKMIKNGEVEINFIEEN